MYQIQEPWDLQSSTRTLSSSIRLLTLFIFHCTTLFKFRFLAIIIIKNFEQINFISQQIKIDMDLYYSLCLLELSTGGLVFFFFVFMDTETISMASTKNKKCNNTGSEDEDEEFFWSGFCEPVPLLFLFCEDLMVTLSGELGFPQMFLFCTLTKDEDLVTKNTDGDLCLTSCPVIKGNCVILVAKARI